jgi:hypothetical protein
MAKKPAKGHSTPPKAQASLASEQAQFVIRGTVLQRGAATLSEVPVREDTLVVRVDAILHGPDILQDFVGQPITVQLGPRQSVTEGEAYLFHTNGWIFGAGLAVVCVGVSAATSEAVHRVQAAVIAKPAQALKARADRAELVASGQVVQVRQVPKPASMPISEHNPEWQEAVVRLVHVAKGTRKAGQEVAVRFAASRDVRWANAPKFSVGEEGVWMLGDKSPEHAEMRAASGVPKDHYLVVDPEDFHPKEHADRVLSQIKTIRRKS